jgi:GNAT superfamily N-acetyltransferase
MLTRFAAIDGEQQWGYIEIDTLLDDYGRFARGQQPADISNLFVEPVVRRRGVARWLLAAAAHWLELAGTGLLLTYLSEEDSEAERAFVAAVGFTTLIKTVRLAGRP